MMEITTFTAIFTNSHGWNRAAEPGDGSLRISRTSAIIVIIKVDKTMMHKSKWQGFQYYIRIPGLTLVFHCRDT